MQPFQIHIPDSELGELQAKLKLARFPNHLDNAKWGENNRVTNSFMRDIVKFWREKYDWREEEKRLNSIGPQYRTDIEVDGFGTVDLHFVHAKSEVAGAFPLLFLHGWPGSFIEVSKVLPLFLKAGFHVVAPSLPGYGFSSLPDKPGFKHEQQAETFDKLMYKLGYQQYVVHGGDWGSDIGRAMALQYPENLKAYHQTSLVMTLPPQMKGKEPTYTKFEQACIDRFKWFEDEEWAYYAVQSTKPRTFGYALHDSPIGMLAWMADKLFLWADDTYPWTYTEIITWSLLHYFPGPTSGMQMYAEHVQFEMTNPESVTRNSYVKVPTGISAFAKEIGMAPRSWGETIFNITYWKEHWNGGHFASYEQPNELAADVVEFFNSILRK